MAFHTHKMVVTDKSATFVPNYVLKHSRPSKKTDVFEYYAFDNKLLCVIDCLNEYVARRNIQVTDNVTQLIITMKKPFHAACADTVRRWVKGLLKECNIFDFSSHSCPSASTGCPLWLEKLEKDPF